MQNQEVFSSHEIAVFSKLLGESWSMLPLEADPPMHAKHRALLEPQLTPKKMDTLIPAIEGITDGLMETIEGKSGCELVQTFAQRFPVMVFLYLFGLPTNQLETFAGWARGLLHDETIEVRAAAAQAVKNRLLAGMKEASERPADEALISLVVHAHIDGRPLTDDEKLGYAFLMFLGGLDTVASSLAFPIRHMAEYHALQTNLREHPELIPVAVEEFLRLYGDETTYRRVVSDIELAGVQLKAGDCVNFSLVSGNRDPKDAPEPDTFRLDRGNNPHVTFGAGKHRCMGAHRDRHRLPQVFCCRSTISHCRRHPALGARWRGLRHKGIATLLGLSSPGLLFYLDPLVR